MPKSKPSPDEIIEEQIKWWQKNGFTADTAWDALNGVKVALAITWNDVRVLARARYRALKDEEGV